MVEKASHLMAARSRERSSGKAREKNTVSKTSLQLPISSNLDLPPKDILSLGSAFQAFQHSLNVTISLASYKIQKEHPRLVTC